MAKNIGKLAGLAALAGAAYMASKGKDEKTSPKGKEDTGAGYKSTETRLKKPSESIAEADKSDKSTSISTKGESGTTTPGTDKSAPDLSESRNKPTSATKTSASKTSASKPVTATSDPRNLEAGMSRGTRTPAKPVSTTSSSEEGMKNYKPRRTPAASTSSSSEEGMKNYKPRNTPVSTQDTTKKAASDTAKTTVKATTNPSSSSTSTTSPAMRETYRDLSGKVRYKEPSGPSAAQMASDAVSSGAKKVGSGIADYVRNFETPAERRSREAKEAKNKPASAAPTREYNEDALSTGSAMRRGGKVKKMASGGMTASRRADGIASRGKTRCKMY